MSGHVKVSHHLVGGIQFLCDAFTQKGFRFSLSSHGLTSSLLRVVIIGLQPRKQAMQLK